MERKHEAPVQLEEINYKSLLLCHVLKPKKNIHTSFSQGTDTQGKRKKERKNQTKNDSAETPYVVETPSTHTNRTVTLLVELATQTYATYRQAATWFERQ